MVQDIESTTETSLREAEGVVHLFPDTPLRFILVKLSAFSGLVYQAFPLSSTVWIGQISPIWLIQKKDSAKSFAESSSLKGRLPTFPLSQYHRRGEV